MFNEFEGYEHPSWKSCFLISCIISGIASLVPIAFSDVFSYLYHLEWYIIPLILLAICLPGTTLISHYQSYVPKKDTHERQNKPRSVE